MKKSERLQNNSVSMCKTMKNSKFEGGMVTRRRSLAQTKSSASSSNKCDKIVNTMTQVLIKLQEVRKVDKSPGLHQVSTSAPAEIFDSDVMGSYTRHMEKLANKKADDDVVFYARGAEKFSPFHQPNSDESSLKRPRYLYRRRNPEQSASYDLDEVTCYVANYLLNTDNPCHEKPVNFRQFAQKSKFCIPKTLKCLSSKRQRRIANRLQRSSSLPDLAVPSTSRIECSSSSGYSSNGLDASSTPVTPLIGQQQDHALVGLEPELC